MTEQGRILVADDEEVFLNSTVDLLRKEGYQCDGVADAPGAHALLRKDTYDLLIADIKMPGNAALEFVRELPEIAQGLPVILVTGYPSMDTAIASVQLPVVAYMVKPLDFDELLKQVRLAVQKSRILRTVAQTHQRLRTWGKDLMQIEKSMDVSQQDVSAVAVSTFVSVTLQNIAAALVELKQLTEAMALGGGQPDVCRLRDCPRLAVLTESLKETVAALEKTKKAFRSKELGVLRERLESVLGGLRVQ